MPRIPRGRTRSSGGWRRNIRRSDLADNALLSLAESDFLAGKLDEARTQFTALVEEPRGRRRRCSRRRCTS